MRLRRLIGGGRLGRRRRRRRNPLRLLWRFMRIKGRRIWRKRRIG
jgi:hypothetical protein